MVLFKPFVFIQVHLTNSPHRQVFVVVFKILEHCPQVQGSVVIKTVKENLLLSSSPSVPSICRRVWQKKLSGRRLRLISDSHYLLLEFGVSLKSGELINFNATCTSKLDWQLVQLLKGAFCHYLEGQQTNLNGRRRISIECKGCANELWHERYNAFQTKMGFSKLSIFCQPLACLSEPALCSLWKSRFSPTSKLIQ